MLMAVANAVDEAGVVAIEVDEMMKTTNRVNVLVFGKVLVITDCSERP
jgi:hypothetical protein